MTIARLILTCTGALLAATLWPLADSAQAVDQDRVIPRKDIFGNPTRTSPAISPDGKSIAYIAPRDGVLNVFVAPSADIAAARPVTADKKRGIREFFWTQNSRQLIYVQDEGGDENWRIHVVDIATAKDAVISPAGKVQGQLIAASVTNPDAILIGINDRDPQNHDVYRHNLKTGEQVLLFRNDEGYSSFVADDSLALRLVARQTPGGGLEVFRRDSAGKLTPFTRISPEDALTTQLIGFDVAGTTLYALDSRGRDKAALVTLDVESGAPKVLAQSEKADVNDTLVHPATGKVQAAQVEYLREEWQPIDPAVKGDIEFLNANARGEWKVTSRSRDDKWWTVRIDRVTEPVAFWLYDRGAKRLAKLFTARPNLEGAPLSPMYPVEIKARDGLTLVSYLTLPRGTDPSGSGKPSNALPMVLYVHGGPWARDTYGYEPIHQWLANRGYAVLSVNYRGSTGFGKKFVNIADMQFAGTMHDDLIDAVKWAVDKGIAQKDKIAIMGGILRRLRDPRGHDVHARHVRLRRRHRGAVESRDADRELPAVLAALHGGDLVQARRRSAHRRGQEVPADPLADNQGRSNQASVADRAGRERSARDAKGIRPDRRRDERAQDPGYLCDLRRRRARLRPSREPDLVLSRSRKTSWAGVLEARAEPIGDDAKGASLEVPDGAAQRARPRGRACDTGEVGRWVRRGTVANYGDGGDQEIRVREFNSYCIRIESAYR